MNVSIFFGDSRANNIFNSLDLNDCGKKLFGSWKEYKTKNNISIDKLVNELSKDAIIGVVMTDDEAWINSNYFMFSDGSKFLTREDILCQYQQ